MGMLPFAVVKNDDFGSRRGKPRLDELLGIFDPDFYRATTSTHLSDEINKVFGHLACAIPDQIIVLDHESVRNLNLVDVTLLDTVDQGVEISSMRVGCSDGAEKATVHIIFTFPVGAVQ
jgi:hypothetical protein